MSEIITSSLLAKEPHLIDLIDKFILRLPELIYSINTAYKNEEKEQFLSAVHQLKGAGGGYGYDILTELCTKVEEQSKSSKEDNVYSLLNEFDTVAQQILAGHDENHKLSEKTHKKRAGY